MRKTRIFIIDGDVGSRRILSRAVERDNRLELVGSSGYGEATLEKVDRVKPELVVLGAMNVHDDGLKILGKLRAKSHNLPVLFASPNAQKASTLTLEALSMGASGYLCFDQGGENEDAIESLRVNLVKQVSRLNLLHKSTGPELTSQDEDLPVSHLGNTALITASPIEAVVIAVSTGGPNALAQIMPAFPAEFPVPIIIVQHMLENFSQSLAARLDALGTLTVREAFAGAEAKPGTVWLAPKGVHVDLRRDHKGIRLGFNDGPEENMCKPAADVLFRSAAKVLGSRVLGVVLTGMGYDGVAGSREIRRVGGTIIAQDIPSSVIEGGMPGNVAEAGLAHKVLPLPQIGSEIVRIARLGRSLRASS
jgi:two-component system chemotaxis response regulator CheB